MGKKRSWLSLLLSASCLLQGKVEAAEGATVAPDDASLLRILADLASPELEVRLGAIRRAGASHHPLFLDPVRALLLGGEVAERAAAADALGDLGVPNTSLDLAALIGALTVASRDPSDTVAGAALRALGRYPFPEVRRALGVHARDPKASSV